MQEDAVLFTIEVDFIVLGGGDCHSDFEHG